MTKRDALATGRNIGRGLANEDRYDGHTADRDDIRRRAGVELSETGRWVDAALAETYRAYDEAIG